MGKFGVLPQKESRLLARMRGLNICEEDLLEKFIKGSGSGGQKINKTSSCVYLLHVPSGIEIKCQKTRSQSLNRYYAREILCETLEQRVLGEKSAREQEREKIRRQKRRRSRRQKERILANKREQSQLKVRRRRVDIDES
ncbi:MAG: peptide chain release factor-like protein [Deltaproteobacteria bacterium]|nr:peptide chain release factor-like protein [Deltaproteobacteria bacterium]